MKRNGKTATATSAKGIIPYLPKEVDDFEAEVARFRAEQVDNAQFTPFRLKQGIYGQRQPDAQMVRVKVPGGILTAEQLDALGELAERYTPLKKGHVTTRENFQFHHVKLEECGEVMRLIGKVGLSTREACGNTVRNVVSCPKAGVCSDELFDVRPYLAAYTRYFVRHPVTQNMPRKFKTAFSPCLSDCAVTGMHDLGFIAQVREENGVQRNGFKILVGGGTSIMAKQAQVLYDFVPVVEYLRVCEGILRVFNQSDELRKNRMMARIKVLIHRIGIDEFRKLVEEEMTKEWAQADFDPTPYMHLQEEEVPTILSNGHSPLDEELSQEFHLWRSTNVTPQRQKGYNVAYVKVPLGDISAEQFHSLADIARKYAGGNARTTAEQNLAFRWVPDASVYALWEELTKIGLAEAEAHTITDVTACPGTDSCKLGITSSMGLGGALRESLVAMNGALDDPLVKELHIKISGCPNGCGRHHVANIGFHGASLKNEGNQIPAYELFLGGNFENGDVKYGDRVKVKIPAKRIPEATKRLINFYQAERKEGESFNRFVERMGTEPFETLISEFREVGPLSKETIYTYMDWEKSVLYKVERGEGECSI